MRVVYFQSDLSKTFSRPKSWQEGTPLSVKAKLKREKQLSTDLIPAKKRSSIAIMLDEELEKSKAFEGKLKEVMNKKVQSK
jgi:hypothetical protein